VLWDTEIANLPDEDLRTAARLAMEATKCAHAIYSEFKVGATLRLANTNTTFTAANVENGSYGLTSCAERNAVFRAVAERGESVRFDLVVILADSSKIDV